MGSLAAAPALTPDQVREASALLAKVDELERRYPNVFFKPNIAQYRFIRMADEVYAQPGARAKVNTFCWLGGNDTGKTRVLSEIAKTLCVGVQSEWFDTPFYRDFKRPCRGRLISTRKALEEGLLRELATMLASDLLPGYPKKAGQQFDSCWCMKNGSRLDVYTWDMSLAQHAGGFIDFALKDEPGSKAVSEETDARLRRGGPVWWALTPIDALGGISADLLWLFDHITSQEEGKDLGYHLHYADAWDNCVEKGEAWVVSPRSGQKVKITGRVPQAVIEDRIRRWSSDPAVLQARIYGRHAREVGKVLREWEDGRHVFEKTIIQPSWLRLAALDYHPGRAQVFNYGCVTPFGELLVLFEIVSDAKLSELAEQIRRVYLAYGPPKIALIDPLAETANPLTGISVAQEFANHGCRFRSAGSEKSDKAVGINKVREMLAGIDGRPLLKVHKECRLTIAQAKRWMVDPKTMAPSKEHDDTWENIYRMALNMPPLPTAQLAAAQGMALSYRSPLVVN